ncbi:oxalate decarboxylase OxdD isoform X1 [Gallus gallus]|uniref:Cupin superfamily member 1A n=1 Tax=Gallus gallus TaxID=9031 RepID=A0A8V0YEY7_CHICK|nr:germin-like protein subfamily 2 member 2-like [Gallus gallus]XP_040511602.1 oxalate decarboxylase OxdD isoform X1 [Gallus gallus]XP_040511603.1 oxalate decarboxylase OxdD isoform X1 [Gallus gallus]XP_040511604.1 oxalate decarboxylase OxdD isoform X1 [Gallus gallus]XP_046761573.1 oxalate decarboxylase OxdD isoform X1 [Gallus gallus]XP_046793285.1 oxalate decarboxylase OxdD isoform X1 [Gallus gallus]XP_046793286.1 oxalate decarboxylase OxdD isoform X1 [Gallus gallus]XP_046793287.1 oxalate d
MDNRAFEMQPEGAARSWKGKDGPQREAPQSNGTLRKLFALCLLAGVMSTALSVASLALVYSKAGGLVREMSANEGGVVNEEGVNEEGGGGGGARFRFFYRLSRTEPQKYPGGQIQWATSRSKRDLYPDPEGLQFGESLRQHQSHMSVALLRIKAGGLRVPHWHFNAAEHGYVLQGTAWVGVASGANATTYNATVGQAVFFPPGAVHWLKNVGGGELAVVLFFGSHEEVKTLDVDEAFFGTAEDIAARALQPSGGLEFIRSFRKASEDQRVNLPPNLAQLVHSAAYGRSEDSRVWRYFYDLAASPLHPFRGGSFRWAPYRPSRTFMSPMERIYTQSLDESSAPLTLALLRIHPNELGQPHLHGNANELAYVVSGRGRAGLVTEKGLKVEMEVGVGDVVFFPAGTQHYLEAGGDEGLLLVVAYSTGKKELKTLRMNQYFKATADHILAQLFRKEQREFQRFPRS